MNWPDLFLGVKQARAPIQTASPSRFKPLINASPTRAQLAAVSAIKILLVGVERLILPPHVLQAMASLRTKIVTIFSVCCPHFWQRIRRMVRSEVENFMARMPTAPGIVAAKVKLFDHLQTVPAAKRAAEMERPRIDLRPGSSGQSIQI